VGNDVTNKFDKIGLVTYDSENEAIIAGAQKIYQLTIDSRNSGIKEYAENFTEKADWSIVKRDKNIVNAYAKNFNIYSRDDLNNEGFVQIILGVEHAIAVFCCPDDDNYQLTDAARGFFPVHEEWRSGTHGKVGIPDVSPCSKGIKVATLHSHNVGSAIVRKGGLEEITNGVANFPSDIDLNNKEKGMKHFVVGEFETNIMSLWPY
jgi:hypothetical protein